VSPRLEKGEKRARDKNRKFEQVCLNNEEQEKKREIHIQEMSYYHQRNISSIEARIIRTKARRR